MITRRDVLTGGAATAAAIAGRGRASAGPSQPRTPVAFAVPPGAWDCHTHVFGDPARFPFAPGRTYTPEPASLDEMRSLHRALGVSRVVVVQPSVYGTDNACTLDALRRLGPTARGVAVIDADTPESALAAMHAAGVRGVRLNLQTAGITDPRIARTRFQAAVHRVARRGWHVQIFADATVIDAIKDLVAGAPVPVVFDHFGGILAARGLQQPGASALLGLLQSGRVYVKMSAPYLVSTRGPDYPDLAPIARALVAANHRQLLWATNWPHPSSADGRPVSEVSPLRQVDDGRLFNLLAAWVPDPTQRRTILVDNPTRLYGP